MVATVILHAPTTAVIPAWVFYKQAAAVQQFPYHSVWAAACRRQRFAGCICKHTFCVDTCYACHAYPVIINFV